MNTENIKHCIEVMKQAQNLNMNNFRSDLMSDINSVEELHSCGSSACFLGYVSLTKKYHDFFAPILSQSADIFIDHSGSIIHGYLDKDGDFLKDLKPSDVALGEFLGVSSEIAESFIYGRYAMYGMDRKLKEIKAYEVIERLEWLLEAKLYDFKGELDIKQFLFGLQQDGYLFHVDSLPQDIIFDKPITEAKRFEILLNWISMREFCNINYIDPFGHYPPIEGIDNGTHS